MQTVAIKEQEWLPISDQIDLSKTEIITGDKEEHVMIKESTSDFLCGTHS